jgi:hypothetical protein
MEGPADLETHVGKLACFGKSYVWRETTAETLRGERAMWKQKMPQVLKEMCTLRAEEHRLWSDVQVGVQVHVT